MRKACWAQAMEEFPAGGKNKVVINLLEQCHPSPRICIAWSGVSDAACMSACMCPSLCVSVCSSSNHFATV